MEWFEFPADTPTAPTKRVPGRVSDRIPSIHHPNHRRTIEPFTHLASQRVVVYTDPSCRYAVLPSNINIYLRAQYRMSAGKRRDIIYYIISIPGLIVSEEHLESVNPNL